MSGFFNPVTVRKYTTIRNTLGLKRPWIARHFGEDQFESCVRAMKNMLLEWCLISCCKLLMVWNDNWTPSLRQLGLVDEIMGGEMPGKNED